jgi:RND family efflux transporter MFP subunit
MKRGLKFVVGTTAVVIVGGFLIYSFLANRAELAAEAQSEQPFASASRVSQNADGQTVIKFPVEMQERLEIHADALAGTRRSPETVAYGHIEEDPSRSFVVRAPVSGNARQAANHPWPDVGQTIADQTVVGSIEPRLAPTDRITLGDRLSSAQADVESGNAALAAAQAALNRARTLNADEKNVSDKAVQEAEARVAAEEARLAAANRSVKLIQSSLASMSGATIPLEADRGGQVVEVMVHPGESVEAGQPMLRVARFGRLLARVDVPAGDIITGNASFANIVPLGYESRPIRAERVSLAAAVDPKTQGQPFLFRVPDPSFALRPGLSVTAYLQLPGALRQGVVVPRSAVVRHTGHTWVYVQTAADEFARREVNLEDPTAEGWFTRSLAAGTRVVTTGAQALLSEELKSQIQVGEENPQ